MPTIHPPGRAAEECRQPGVSNGHLVWGIPGVQVVVCQAAFTEVVVLDEQDCKERGVSVTQEREEVF